MIITFVLLLIKEFMKRVVYLSAVVIVSLLSFSGCDKANSDIEKENEEEAETTKGPKIETLSAEKGRLCAVSLMGRVSGLEGVALDFQCGIEYSTDSNFSESKTFRTKVNKKYSEVPFIATITVSSSKKYYYRAYYINQVMLYYGEVKDFTFTWDGAQNGSEHGRKYVDLGLSVKWATLNVGASVPEGLGGYYAWGETKTKTDYLMSTYKFCISHDSYGNDKFNKYVTNLYNGYNYGDEDNKTILDPEDDVAHFKWGGSWRMPTKAEQDELCDNCTWTWTSLNGVNGYLVSSNIEGYTDRFIFLPAAGSGDNGSFDNHVGMQGHYWSSSLYENRPRYAWCLSFDDDDYFRGSYGYAKRSDGLSIRPVCP